MAGCGPPLWGTGHARLSPAAAAGRPVHRPPGPPSVASAYPAAAACGAHAHKLRTRSLTARRGCAPAPRAGPPDTVAGADLHAAAHSTDGPPATSDFKDLDLVNNCVPIPGLAVPMATAAAAASRAAAAGDGGAGTAGGTLTASQDEIVHTVLDTELEHINQAVHAAFEQEMVAVNLTVQEAVETALLDRSFDVKANLNTMVALTGVILYWRGVWTLFDNWLGTDNVASMGSIFIGLSVMLLFRIFKLPLAEFW